MSYFKVCISIIIKQIICTSVFSLHFHNSNCGYIIDLARLQHIYFIGGTSEDEACYALAGDDSNGRKTVIDGHDSYSNTLVMRSTMKPRMVFTNRSPIFARY